MTIYLEIQAQLNIVHSAFSIVHCALCIVHSELTAT